MTKASQLGVDFLFLLFFFSICTDIVYQVEKPLDHLTNHPTAQQLCVCLFKPILLVLVLSMGVRRNFSRGGAKSNFAYLFQIVGDATDVHKNKMSNVTATLANSVFPVRKLYTEQIFVLVSVDILRLS